MVEKMKKEIKDSHNIFWFLSSSIVILLASYLYLVGHTVYTAVERQNAEKNIATMETEVEKLELSYFELKTKVTTELARSRGFDTISSATFIPRKTLTKTLTLNNEI